MVPLFINVHLLQPGVSCSAEGLLVSVPLMHLSSVLSGIFWPFFSCIRTLSQLLTVSQNFLLVRVHEGKILPSCLERFLNNWPKQLLVASGHSRTVALPLATSTGPSRAPLPSRLPFPQMPKACGGWTRDQNISVCQELRSCILCPRAGLSFFFCLIHVLLRSRNKNKKSQKAKFLLSGIKKKKNYIISN